MHPTPAVCSDWHSYRVRSFITSYQSPDWSHSYLMPHISLRRMMQQWTISRFTNVERDAYIYFCSLFMKNLHVMCLLGWTNQNDEMCGECSMHMDNEKLIQNFGWNKLSKEAPWKTPTKTDTSKSTTFWYAFFKLATMQWRSMGNGGRAPFNLWPRHLMKVSGQLHAPAAVLPGKEPLTPTVMTLPVV
jgi:hypothetical protein